MQVPGDKTGVQLAVSIRRMTVRDITAIQHILEESPEASMWSKESLVDSISGGIAWIAELDGGAAGILLARVVADEFEILNVAVGRSCRRRGIATRLVSVAMDDAQSVGGIKTYLEVRASNEGAIALYQQLGFQVCGRRPNYYTRPIEDALLLVLNRIGTRSGTN